MQVCSYCSQEGEELTCIRIFATSPPIIAEMRVRFWGCDRGVGLSLRASVFTTAVGIAAAEATNVLLQDLRRVDIKEHRVKWVGKDAETERR